MIDCPDCGSTHLGSRCNASFRERLLSVRLDTSVTQTRTKTAYYDKESLDATLGEDRRDRYWDETEGQGALHRTPTGDFVHTNYKGETAVASPELIDSYLGDEVSPNILNE